MADSDGMTPWPNEAGKYLDMGQMAGKPYHFSTLLQHLFKVQGFSVLSQQIEACLRTAVECNPWFPDERSFDLEIWHQAKENVERATRQGKNISIDFRPLWALTEAVILPFKGNSSPPDIQQQAEHLLHEYELDDETLRKAQLEQNKNISEFSYKPCPGCSKGSSPASGHKSQSPSLART